MEQKITQSKAESDKKLEDYKKEVNPQLVNANGKMTKLQEDYQKMDKNISNFEAQVTGNFDSYESRLQQGNFVVTGNTVFDGNVNIVSKGTNERLQINQGSIETFRTFQNIEYKVSRMGNSRSGLIETDSKGKGTIELVGFKQPIQIICALSTVSFGKNLSDIICKAENITNTPWPTYKFYLGATNEHYVEPKPIKIIGQEWSAENAVESTLLGYGGNVPYRGREFGFTKIVKGGYSGYGKTKWNVTESPSFSIKIVRIENEVETTLIEKIFTLHCSVYPEEQHIKADWQDLNFNEVTNLLRRYEDRTNVRFKMLVTIIQPNLSVDVSKRRNHGSSKDPDYKEYTFKGIAMTLTLADFTGFSITASAATSTIGDIQGEGTVQYLAFETE